jgi:putative restriction endonuclease
VKSSSVADFLLNSDWDAPFFKKLSHNYSGQAAGHQGGIVFPKDLRAYLPSLDEGTTSAHAPTTDRYLHANLFIGLKHVGDMPVRYQLQTWGGTRSAESRITDGLAPVRGSSGEGDILIFQRRIDSLTRFRLLLFKKNTPEYQEIEPLVAGRRWGKLYADYDPLTQGLLVQTGREIETLTERPFELLKKDVAKIETRQKRVARSVVFREMVRRQYANKCAISGIVVATPSDAYEVESAHIVPISKGGADDVRNGFSLCQTMHWAFDRGLIGVTADRKIYLPKRVRLMKQNLFLLQFQGTTVAEANAAHFRVHKDAFAWHFENCVKQWD